MFEQLTAAIDGIACLQPEEVRAADIVAFEKLVRRMEAEHIRLVAQFAAGGLWALDGASTAGSWQRQHLGIDPGEANVRARIARRLEDRKLWREAFEAGCLSRAHLQALITGTRLWPADVLDEHEQWLLDAALATHPGKLAERLRAFEAQFLPERTEEREDRAHENRGVTLSTSAYGVTLLRGDLDTRGGAVVETAIQAMAAPLADDQRTASQRRHDALVAVCQLALDQGLIPSQNGRKPHVTVTVGLEALQGDAAAPAADVAWVGPVSRGTLLRLCCDASITRVVLDPVGIPVDVGRTMRLAPAGLRRALEIRDAGCVHPGCDMPLEWTEVHHRRHWADGGETTVDNTCLACDRHHDLWHRRGLMPQREPDGTWTLVPYPERT